MVTAKMAVGAVAGVGLQLGLAILGWGGFTAFFFAEPALTALVVATVVATAVATLTPANLSSGDQEDRSNRWVIAALVVLSLALAYVPALTDRLDILVIGGATVRWIGIALFILGNILRLWPVFVLGRRFSGLVAIQQDHQLVTSGLYGAIRHPSYLGLLLTAVGWALVFRSIIGVLIALATIPVLIARMNSEEALLSAHFGAQYMSYKQRTNRLIPGLY